MTALAALRARIATAAVAAGRDPAAITLIGVSKTQPAAAITALAAQGLGDFGENRVQEAAKKFIPLRATGLGLRLHLIGPLQTNKVKDAVRLFDVLHSVDRPRLAEALGAEMARQKTSRPCFLQVNTGDEPQKSGVTPRELEALFRLCREDCGLEVAGLMAIPPVDADAGAHFALLRRLAGGLGLTQLSMGMSADFESAIAHGATHLRVGAALFGPRG